MHGTDLRVTGCTTTLESHVTLTSYYAQVVQSHVTPAQQPDWQKETHLQL